MDDDDSIVTIHIIKQWLSILEDKKLVLFFFFCFLSLSLSSFFQKIHFFKQMCQNWIFLLIYVIIIFPFLFPASWDFRRGPERVPHFLRLLFCYEKKKFFFLVMNTLKGKKTCYFAFWRKTFFVMKVKKEENLLLEKKQEPKLVIVTKQPKCFVISPKKTWIAHV